MYSHGHTSTDTLGDVMTDVSGERNVRPVGFDDGPEPIETTTENGTYHTTRQGNVHVGAFDGCPECSPAPVPDPEQLCFAIATKTGTLVTRDGRPLWATRKLWSELPERAAQIIPITGAPPIGSM